MGNLNAKVNSVNSQSQIILSQQQLSQPNNTQKHQNQLQYPSHHQAQQETQHQTQYQTQQQTQHQTQNQFQHNHQKRIQQNLYKTKQGYKNPYYLNNLEKISNEPYIPKLEN